MNHRCRSDSWILWPVSDLKDLCYSINKPSVEKKISKGAGGSDRFEVAILAKAKQAIKLRVSPPSGKKKKGF